MRKDGWVQYLNALKTRERSWPVPDTIPADIPKEIFEVQVKFPCQSIWHHCGIQIWVIGHFLEYGEAPLVVVSDKDPQIDSELSRQRAFMLRPDQMRFEIRVN